MLNTKNIALSVGLFFVALVFGYAGTTLLQQKVFTPPTEEPLAVTEATTTPKVAPEKKPVTIISTSSTDMMTCGYRAPATTTPSTPLMVTWNTPTAVPDLHILSNGSTNFESGLNFRDGMIAKAEELYQEVQEDRHLKQLVPVVGLVLVERRGDRVPAPGQRPLVAERADGPQHQP